MNFFTRKRVATKCLQHAGQCITRCKIYLLQDIVFDEEVRRVVGQVYIPNEMEATSRIALLLVGIALAIQFRL